VWLPKADAGGGKVSGKLPATGLRVFIQNAVRPRVIHDELNGAKHGRDEGFRDTGFRTAQSAGTFPRSGSRAQRVSRLNPRHRDGRDGA
jgi:hypothetical protein